MRKCAVHLGSAHSRARPARPKRPCPLGRFSPRPMKQGGDPPRRRRLTSQIRPAGSRWSVGKWPGSKPGRRRSQFEVKGGGRLTGARSRQRWRSGEVVHRCGGRLTVVGSVGEVGEDLRARVMLLAGRGRLGSGSPVRIMTGGREWWRWRARAVLCSGPGPINLFQKSKYFPIAFKWSELQKYETGTSKVSQISKPCQAVDKFKRNNFPFGKDFKFLAAFE
jgi:hypothetical protein